MNRRHFFGMTLGALTAAGLSPLLLPHRSIFLPPRGGWKQWQLGDGYMRECQQYVFYPSDEGHLYRYDAIGRDIWGTEHQFSVDARMPCPEVARKVLGDVFRHHGLEVLYPGQGQILRLKLPHNCEARYI